MKPNINEAIKNGGYYDRHGVWNAIKTLPPDTRVYRDRVETIIVKNNKEVFVKKKPNGEYFLPGGSKEKDIPDDVQAANECREEARINVRNVEYSGITLKSVNKPSKNDDKFIWTGALTDIYTAEYDSLFKGQIDKVDKDPFILSGKFYPVKQCLRFFKDEHRDALIWFLKNHIGSNEVISESVYTDNIDKFIYKNIKSPEDLLRWMKVNIKYSNFTKLKSPNELYESKTGSCHDQSLFVKYVFNKLHIKNGTLFMIEVPKNGGAGGETHSLTYFKRNKKIYWFESAWGGNQGIFGPYDTIGELKTAVEKKWNKKDKYPILYMTTVKNIQNGMDLGEFVNACCSDEEAISESGSRQYMFHVSRKNLDGLKLNPSIPNNFLTQNKYEDSKTPRVCFSATVDGAIMALSMRAEGLELFVHIPDRVTEYYIPNGIEVPDGKITGEMWVKEPVRVRCIGKIRILKDAGLPGHKYQYGNHTAELFDWDWEWIERYDNEVFESKLTTEERDNLKTKTFGIPELRKYPLNDRNHVIAAIRYFNHVDKEHEAELARNIIKAMKKYNIQNYVVGEKNRLKNYLKG